jgi:hypothetical protein
LRLLRRIFHTAALKRPLQQHALPNSGAQILDRRL